MALRPSRTYKLKLSDQGIGLFLDCHARLGHLACDLLPYGLTLRVAVALFAQLSVSEQARWLSSAELAAATGKTIRFVGTTPSLAEETAYIVSELARHRRGGSGPATWQVFLAALSFMRSAEDVDVVRAAAVVRETDAAEAAWTNSCAG